MFWVGVCIAAWGCAIRLGRQTSFSRFPPNPFEVYQVLALATLGWSSMFPAIWALLGRSRQGVVIGVGMWALMLILSFLFMVC